MNCVLFAEMDQVFSLKIIDIKKILENGKKYWKSQGILSVQKSGNPDRLMSLRSHLKRINMVFLTKISW